MKERVEAALAAVGLLRAIDSLTDAAMQVASVADQDGGPELAVLLDACAALKGAVEVAERFGFSNAIIRDTDDSWRRKTAYHEAGHAVVATALGYVVESVVLDGHPFAPANYAGGANVKPEWDLEPSEDARNQATIAFSGLHAAHRYDESLLSSGANGDFERARNYLKNAGFAEDASEIWAAHERAAQLVSENWEAVERVAEALFASGRLGEEEIAALFLSPEKKRRRTRNARARKAHDPNGG